MLVNNLLFNFQCPSPAVSNSNKKHNSQMEEPPLYRVNPQNPQQQPPPHRSELNYPDRTRLQYPGKIYENQMMAGGYNNEQNLNGAKYSQQDMTGSIEKPPPLLRNREEPGSAPRYYPSSSSSSSTSNQGRNPESPPMLGKELAMQSNMIYSNINGEFTLQLSSLIHQSSLPLIQCAICMLGDQ